MGGAAALADNVVADYQYEVKMLRHDDVGVDRYHAVMSGDGGEQLLSYRFA